MSTTDGRKLVIGLKKTFDISSVADAFKVSKKYGDGSIHKISDPVFTGVGKLIYIYYIILNDTSKIDSIVSEPWTLVPPNTVSTSPTEGLYDGKVVDINSNTSVDTVAKNIIGKVYNSTTVFNQKDDKYANYISSDLFKKGDFKLSEIKTDSGRKPLLFLISTDKYANKEKIAGITNPAKFQRAYVIVEPTTNFFAGCCAESVSTGDDDKEETRSFCPTGYSDGGSACGTLMNTYCTKSSTNTKDYLKDVCGCYPDYIKAKIVDKDPSIKALLKELGISQLPSGCYATCRNGKAYTANRETCNVTICNAEINNSGVINSDHIDMSQDCKSTINNNSSGGGSSGDGGSGGGGSSGDGGSNGGSGGDNDSESSIDTKTIIIISSIVGGLLLLLFLLLLIV